MRALLVVSLLAIPAGCRSTAPAGDAGRELAALCAADQADRAGDWSKLSEAELVAIGERDATRRERVRALVADGAPRTSDDLYNAALVLQHGEGKDFLLAHVLASAAAFEGREDARWLAAASLDRALHSLGQPQVFGTQFHREGDGPWTMEPLDRSLHDALRARFGVPPLEEAECRLETLRGGGGF